MVADRTPQQTAEIRQEVAERYNLQFPDVVLEPVWWGRRPTNRADDRFAIVDQREGHLFNICTGIYKPVYHEELIYMVEEASNKLPEFGKPTINVQLLADGGKLRVEVKFTEVEYDINPNRPGGDIVNPTIDVFSSYDLGWKYGGQFGAYRLICSNGAKVGTIFDSFKKRHLTSLDPMELSTTISSGMIKFSDQTDLWKNWATQKMLPKVYNDMWEELPFSAPEKEKIEMLPEAGTKLLLPEALKSGDLTRWDFFNVVTQYATHEIKSEIRRIEIQPTITRVFEKFQNR